MNNSINWTGNRVLDPNASRQMQQPTTPMAQGQMRQPTTPMAQGQMPQPTTPMAQGQMQQPTTPMMPRQMPQSTTPFTPIQQGNAITQQGPPPSTEKGYIPNYLASNIGKYVRAEFIIGTTQYVDKTGVIAEVGVNYFVLHDVNARADVMCDLYSVKFVTIPEVQSSVMIPPI